MRPYPVSPQMADRLKKALYGLLSAWVSTYTYDHLVKPLDTPPRPSGVQEEARPSVGEDLAPDLPPRVPNDDSNDPSAPELRIGPVSFPDGTGAHVYGHRCEMPDGRSLNFRVVVFSEAYSWVYERTDLVQLNDRRIGEAEFVSLLGSPGLQEVMGRAHALVAAGTASCEGSEWSREDDRALQRASTLGAWIERARPWPADGTHSGRSLYLLNLGRYWQNWQTHEACGPGRPRDTWHQRKVLLLAIVEQASDAELSYCLGQSLRTDDQLRPLLDHYVRFDLNETSMGDPL